MKGALINCSCQICQGVKARGYHFDSFQHPFCWSSMLLLHYVPTEVMGEQRIMCFWIDSKRFLNCICCISTSFGRLTLYLWKACIWKRERKWKTISICWVCTEQTMWSYSCLVSQLLFPCWQFYLQIKMNIMTPTWSWKTFNSSHILVQEKQTEANNIGQKKNKSFCFMLQHCKSAKLS